MAIDVTNVLYTSKDLSRFWRKVDTSDHPKGCWLWTASLVGNGYGKFWFDGKDGRAHRFSYLIHYGSLSIEDNVLHSCDNPSCVNPQHLFLGSDQDNINDKVIKERQARGETQGIHKLTEHEAVEIRQRYSIENITQRDLSEIYGVKEPTINDVINRRTWMHV